MRLFTLNLFVEGFSNPVRLNYRDETRAKTAFAVTRDFEGMMRFNDDYGVEAIIGGNIMARVLVDAVEELEAGIEHGLNQARAQMKAQQKAKSDPTLSNGGIIAPGGPVVPFPPRGAA